MKKNLFKQERLVQNGGIVVLLLFLFGYILFPALKTVEVSLVKDGVYSFLNYYQLLSVESYRMPLINSIILGFMSVLVCGFVGVLLAFLVHFFEIPCKSLLDKLLLLPMVMPGIIVVFAFVQLYGESGLVTKSTQLLLGLDKSPFRLTGLPGILFVHAYTQYVYFYISVSIAIRHIDYSVIESARNLGASKTKVFTSIILPFLKPAIIAASAMTFISGIGSFTAPSIIGGSFKVLTTQILLSKANNYMHVAATQVVILTIISLMLFCVFRFYESRSEFISSVKGVLIQPVSVSNKLVRFAIMAFTVLMVTTILLPIFTIILVSLVPSSSWMVNYFPQEFSLENYQTIFTSSRKTQPFFNSITMAIVASAVGLIVALWASYIIVKTKHPLRLLVEFLVMLPWAIPASAIAINIINAFNEPSIFSFNKVLVGTSILLPLGYFIRSLPIVVKILNLSFQNLNDGYIEASKSLGASKFYTFRRIALPIIFPGILAGFLLIFIRSIGEYTVSLFLYNASNKPISIAMVNAVFEYNMGLAMAYGTLLVFLTFVLSVMISRFMKLVST
ncbi:MAG: iron ABC transporter permease [Desulfotalea sp.]